MSNGTNRPTTRSIKVSNLSDDGASNQLSQHLTQVIGIQDVTTDPGKGAVVVTYDLMQTGLPEIEGALSKAGFPPANGLLSKMVRGWQRYTEENERAHMKHVPHCCSKPPR